MSSCQSSNEKLLLRHCVGLWGTGSKVSNSLGVSDWLLFFCHQTSGWVGQKWPTCRRRRQFFEEKKPKPILFEPFGISQPRVKGRRDQQKNDSSLTTGATASPLAVLFLNHSPTLHRPPPFRCPCPAVLRPSRGIPRRRPRVRDGAGHSRQPPCVAVYFGQHTQLVEVGPAALYFGWMGALVAAAALATGTALFLTAACLGPRLGAHLKP